MIVGFEAKKALCEETKGLGIELEKLRMPSS